MAATESRPERDDPRLFAAAARWLSRRPRLVIALILAGSLGPFINKAVNTDDPLFVWAGEWIQKHPGDFYGGPVNWWISTVPMWVANWNPPLLSCLFAAMGAWFGWGEVVLHLSCLLVTFGACAGMFALAQGWCSRPLLAAVIALFTPAFLVSASTLMCDVPMLALWIWSVVFWERGLAAKRGTGWFLAAGSLAGLAVLTKYSAVSLLPLLPLLGILRTRRPGWWLLGLAPPLVIVAGYEVLTAHLYGEGLLAAASYHARSFRPGFPGGWRATAVIGLAFAGGSVLPALLFAPWLWRRSVWLAGLAVTAGGGAVMCFFWDRLGLVKDPAPLKHWGYVFQVALLAAGGAQVLVLAAVEWWRRRDVIATVLVAWVASGLCFAIIFNWLINARSFLPLAPAVAILLVRRLETAPVKRTAPGWWLAPLIPSAAVALSLVFSDSVAAGAERRAAREAAAQYRPAGHQLWFTGHGAFQYYLQQAGGEPIDATHSLLRRGDVVVAPVISYGLTSLPAGAVGWLGHLSYHPFAWMNLSGSTAGNAAGFYGANWGPVPFAWGGIPGPTYLVVKVFSDMQMDSKAVNESGGRIQDVPDIPVISCVVREPAEFPGKLAAAPELQLAETSAAAGQTREAIGHYQRALSADPENVAALNELAWLLATANDRSLRNGREAVRLAARAVQRTDSRLPEILGTLAAAYAEAGDFPRAIETSKVAISLAHLTGQDDLARRQGDLMGRYLAGKTADSARR